MGKKMRTRQVVAGNGSMIPWVMRKGTGADTLMYEQKKMKSVNTLEAGR